MMGADGPHFNCPCQRIEIESVIMLAQTWGVLIKL